MTPTIADQIIQVIENLAQKFGIVVNWSSENILPTIEQLMDKYVAYEISTSIMWIIVLCITAVLCVIGYIVIILHREELYFGADDIVAATICLALIIGSIAIPLIIQIADIIKCNIVPELVIVEYIRSFIN